jgi:hypothetical protein
MSGDYVPAPGRAAAQEEALFGPPAKVPTQRRVGPVRAVVQDMDLIESVLATAREPGYVVIGAGDRVYRRVADRAGHIERVPDYEEAAVHQLITQKLLTLGGGHSVRHGNHEGRANSVLVPAATARQAEQWQSYQRPATWGPTRHST